MDVNINGKPVPLEKLPCSKCEYRYSIVCPQCDWNKDGKYDVYCSYEESIRYGKENKMERQIGKVTKLKKYLDDHCVSLAQLSKKVDVDYDKLWRVVKGTQKIDVDTAKKIVEALGCNYEDIID